MSNVSEAHSWGSCTRDQSRTGRGSARDKIRRSNARLLPAIFDDREVYLRAAEGDDPAEEGADGTGDAELAAVVADGGPHRREQAAVGGARLRLHCLDEAVRHGAGRGGARERLHSPRTERRLSRQGNSVAVPVGHSR
jgi:hypothetical protein